MVGVIGLTGGIASGKTTIANFFEKLRVPVIDADEIAHDIIKPNTNIYQTIVSHFGRNILRDDQTIDRKKLRDVVFQNPRERQWLESLLHPVILHNMVEAIQNVNAPYCICVIPLLAESSGIDFIHRVLVVTSGKQLQLNRATKRDVASAESIENIMASQSSHEDRIKIANDVIENNGDLAQLEKKVAELHERYLKLYSAS